MVGIVCIVDMVVCRCFHCEYGVDNLDVGIDYTDRSKPKSLTDIRYYQTIAVLAMRLDSIYFK